MPSSDILRSRIEQTLPAAGYYDDIHGLPAWRRHVTLLFAEQIRAELSAEVSA
jgi:hypothetical protein